MGGGLSQVVLLAQNNPKIFDQYRNEIAEMFSKEFENYKQEGICVREAQEKIYQKIKKEDVFIISKIMRTLHQEEKGQTNETATEQEEQALQNNILLNTNLNRTKRALKFICCIDGSEGSDLAFKTTMRLWKRHDHVILFHAFLQSRQNELPPLFRAQNVKQRYEGQVMERGIPSNQTLFQFEDKGKFNTFTVLRNYLMKFRYTWESSGLTTPMQSERTDPTSQYMSSIPPDFVLIGYNGRTTKEQRSAAATATGTGGGAASSTSNNGEKENHLYLTMGSTTNVTFRNLHIPCIICKRQIPYATSTGKSDHRTFSRPLTFLMAIDQTPQSKNGLEILLQLVRSCDTLKLVHFIVNENKNYFSINEGEESFEDTAQNEEKEEKKGREGREDQQQGNESNENENKYPLSLQRKYERFLLNRGPKQTEVLLIPVPVAVAVAVAVSTTHEQPSSSSSSSSLKEYICQYVNAENPDFFAIAPRSQQNLTSLTESLIGNITTSIILCKN